MTPLWQRMLERELCGGSAPHESLNSLGRSMLAP
jgi:hypothetical protein